MALTLNDDDAKKLIESGNPLLIDFWAEWCGPCKRISPIIEQLSAEYEGKITIGKYNVDDNSDLSTDYSIRNIPTLLFFKDGELKERHVGSASKSDIEEVIKGLL